LFAGNKFKSKAKKFAEYECVGNKKSGVSAVTFPPSVANYSDGCIRNQHQVNNSCVKALCRAFSHLLNGFIANRALRVHIKIKGDEKTREK
jgi:hypothetical protein